MPRSPRIAIAHLPHHIVQRGHSRNPVFLADADCVDYLGTLAEFRATLGLSVYAYCLMTNHVHLIVDPGDEAGNLSELMRRLAGRHSRRLNAAHGTSGSLWEGRFKCSPIDSERYLLTCGRYVDQNPVRAQVVSRPDAFKWSSYRARAGLVESPILDADPAIEALAASAERRFEVYRSLAGVPLTEDQLEIVRSASSRNQLTGDESFVEQVKNDVGLDVPARPRGRPRNRK